MENKKSHKADLENKRFVFFEFSIIIVLVLVIMAFEWGTTNEANKLLSQMEGEEMIEDEIINTFQDEKPPPPPPVKPIVIEIINIVDNDIEIDDELNLEDMDTDIDEEIAVENLDEEVEVDENEIFFLVENMPEFPGGIRALRKFLGTNVEYPQIAIESGLSGRITVKFVIDKTGSVTKVEILKGIDKVLDDAALEVVRKLPKFKPGSQRGKPVNVSYTVPVTFKLNTY